MAALGTCTVSTWLNQGIRGFTFDWESNSGGIVSDVTCLQNVTGVLRTSHVHPNENSGYVPDSGFDVYLFDEHSTDLFNDAHANVGGAPTKHKATHSYPTSDQILLTNESIRPHVINAGNNKRGQLIITLT